MSPADTERFSFASKDIPEGAVAAGNPIKIIKQLTKPYATLPKVHKDIT